MKRYNKFIFILFVTAILSGIATSLEAQDKPKKKKTALIEVKGLVTDNTGKPLSGVTVLSGEGSIINYTDANGKFALKTKAYRSSFCNLMTVGCSFARFITTSL